MLPRLNRLAWLVAALTVSGCASTQLSLPVAGPLGPEVEAAASKNNDRGIVLVDLDDARVRRLVELARGPLLSEVFGATAIANARVGPGDALEVSVWEAPPAALFGSGGIQDARSMASGGVRATVLPEQVVGANGHINVPFVGSVPAAGRSLQEIEEDVARQLRSKANNPQVMVRLLRNVSSTVTVVGEVSSSVRMPLTPRGERLLDALAAAGGARQPVGKVTVQLTREVLANGQRAARVVAAPLDKVVTDPSQNVLLQPGDVVTVLHQPNSLMLLGATTRNEEINFEAQGITLAQTLARAGGLQDQRANPEAVFIFRFEEPTVLSDATKVRTAPDGRVPVIYRVNLRDPASFFMAQGFPMRNRDILYVSNAPAAELQKFLNIVSSVVTPVFTIRALTN